MAMQALTESMDRLSAGGSPLPFDMDREYLYQEELYGMEGRPATSISSQEERHFGSQFALLLFEHPVTAPRVRASSNSDIECYD